MEDRYIVQIRNIFTVLLVITVLAIFKLTGSVSINLILSLLIFFFVLPFVAFLEKHKVPQILAGIIAILLVIVVFLLAIWFIAFVAELLVKELPAYAGRMNQLDDMLSSFLGRFVEIEDGTSISNFFQIDWVSIVMPLIRSTSEKIVNVIKNSFITIIFVLFLLIERHTIIPKMLLAVDENNHNKVLDVLDKCNRQVSKYVAIKFLVSFVTGVLFYVISKAVRLDFALIWGVLAVIMNFIPTFGSIIITLLIILMAMLQYLPVWTPVIFVAVASVAVQFILGNIVEPRIQGNHLNLSPFVILVAVSIFGYIWGLMGMFLAVPLLCIIEIVISNIDATRGLAIMLSSQGSFRRTEYGRKGMKKTQQSLFDVDYESQKH